MQTETSKTHKFSEYLFPLIILIFIIFLLMYARKAILPLILSSTLAYILNPLVNYFEVRGIKRAYVVSSLYIIFGIMIALLVFLILNLVSFDIETFKMTWPDYFSKLEKIINDINLKLTKYMPFLSNLKLEQKLLDYALKIPDYLVSFIPSLIYVFIVPFITFFILLSGSSLFDYILDHIPSKYCEILLHITTRIDESLGNYLRGILTEAFVLFLISFIGLFLLKIDYFSIIAIIVGITSLVPYAGAFVGAALSALMAYFQYQNIVVVLKVLLFFVLIRFFDDWFLQPYIMKRAVNLNPALIVFSLMAGGEIAGFWGIIFAIPLTCVIKEILIISMELQETEFSWKPKPEPIRISIPYT